MCLGSLAALQPDVAANKAAVAHLKILQNRLLNTVPKPVLFPFYWDTTNPPMQFALQVDVDHFILSDSQSFRLTMQGLNIVRNLDGDVSGYPILLTTADQNSIIRAIRNGRLSSVDTVLTLSLIHI